MHCVSSVARPYVFLLVRITRVEGKSQGRLLSVVVPTSIRFFC